MSVTLLVADDHEAVRAGLNCLLAGTSFKIVAEASSGVEAIRLAGLNQPDIVLLDIRMPDGDGLAALSQLRLKHDKLPIVMLSAHDNPSYIAKSVALGANGFFFKGGPKDRLLEVLQQCADEGSGWTRGDLRRVSGGLAAPQVEIDVDYALTHRETEVLKQVAAGLNNNGIAEVLGISRETVKEHVQNILRKLGFSDRTQAAVWAVRHGFA